MRSLLALVLLTGMLVFAGAAPAPACSCADAGPRTLLRMSSVAFAGVVEGRREADDQQVTELAVDRVWAGAVRERTEVVHGTMDGSCGFAAGDGERLVVYAERVEGVLTTSLCSVRSGQSTMDEAVAALGDGEPPTAGSLEASVESGPTVPWRPIGIGAAVLLLVAAMRLRRRA
jgi:hypothetical protein